MERIKAAARKAVVTLGGRHWLARYGEWRLANRAAAAAPPAPARAPDGFALPPAYLRYMTGAAADWRYFLQNGEAAARFLLAALERSGAAPGPDTRILDFGCGCGRVIRHVASLTEAALTGVDYNSRLVRWCRRHLPGTYARNRLQPPLPFAGGAFDVVYALSVLTHLRAETQDAWIAELARVLAPSGVALLSFHDERQPNLAAVGLTPEALIEKGFHVHRDHSEGSNFLAAFQSAADARARFEQYFDVLEIIPSDATPMAQALGVLRRR